VTDGEILGRTAAGQATIGNDDVHTTGSASSYGARYAVVTDTTLAEPTNRKPQTHNPNIAGSNARAGASSNAGSMMLANPGIIAAYR
jgi:hypothetical protein